MLNGQILFTAVFPELPAGLYTLWGNVTRPAGEITIVGGEIAEVDWRDITGSRVAIPHGLAILADPTSTSCMLPPRYQNGKSVSAAPMGTAPMRYGDDGQVAWNEMWTDFCDLALAGGPPHRGDLLEPAPPDEVRADLEGYERVLDEIERGLCLVTTLSTVRSKKPGWIGLRCHDEEMVLWLLRAIVVENVCVRREGCVLYLPVGPGYRLEKEIKNVITVVAKTHHYWMEHIRS
jgi:sirohydrochlorin cobaltochelatase